MTIVITPRVRNAIDEHLRSEYPREGCGLLVGRDGQGGRRIEYAVPARNCEARSERRYSIAPEEFLRAEKEARGRGLEVVGFYHSHPDALPDPSPSDAAEAWPHYTYLIVAVASGRSGPIKAWRFDAGSGTPEMLRLDAANGAG